MKWLEDYERNHEFVRMCMFDLNHMKLYKTKSLVCLVGKLLILFCSGSVTACVAVPDPTQRSNPDPGTRSSLFFIFLFFLFF